MNSAALGYSPELEPQASQLRDEGLGPVSATFLGFWYSLILAAAVTSGTKYLSKHDPYAHYLLNALSWVVGAGMGAVLASALSKRFKLLVAAVSPIPAALVWLVVVSLGTDEMEPLAFGFSPSFREFGYILLGLTLLVGLIGGLVWRSYTDELNGFQSIRPGHWFWLWIAMYAWVAMIPVAVYYVWLEIITSGYFAIHPSLWFRGDWDMDVAFGLMPGVAGIGLLAYGVELSLNTLLANEWKNRPLRRRVMLFLLGTIVLGSLVSPFLLNWGIDHLKDVPLVSGTRSWWVL